MHIRNCWFFCMLHFYSIMNKHMNLQIRTVMCLHWICTTVHEINHMPDTSSLSICCWASCLALALAWMITELKPHPIGHVQHIIEWQQQLLSADCNDHSGYQGWGQVLFEVLESSTSTFSYLQVQVQVQVLRVLGRHQIHQVLFQSSTSTLVTNNSIFHSTTDGLRY